MSSIIEGINKIGEEAKSLLEGADGIVINDDESAALAGEVVKGIDDLTAKLHSLKDGRIKELNKDLREIKNASGPIEERLRLAGNSVKNALADYTSSKAVNQTTQTAG